MTLRDLSRFSAGLAGLLIAAVSLAQQAPSLRNSAVPAVVVPSPSQVQGSPNFGTADLTYVRFNGLDFYPYRSVFGYESSGNLRWALQSSAGMEAPLRIPTGAIIEHLAFELCDTNPGAGISLGLLECDFTGSCSYVASVASAGAPGCTIFATGFSYTVNNLTHAIGLEAIGGASDGSVSIAGAAVGYRLQVSPAPGINTFGDVLPGTTYFQFIEALAASGITAGCDAVPNYCPDRSITRAEMAVFLAKALGLHFPN